MNTPSSFIPDSVPQANTSANVAPVNNSTANIPSSFVPDTQQQVNTPAQNQSSPYSGESGIAAYDIVKNMVTQAIGGVKQVGTGLGQVAEGVYKGFTSPDPMEGGNLSSRGALNVTAGVFNTVFSPVGGVLKTGQDYVNDLTKSATGKTAGDYLNPVVEKLSNNPVLQKFAVDNPNAPEIFSNILSTVAGLVALRNAPAIKSALTDNPNPSDLTTVNKIVSGHFQESGDVIKTVPPDQFAQLGGMPELLSRTKINVVDGLKGEGYTDVANTINSIPTTPDMTLEQFNQAVNTAIGSAEIKPPIIPISVRTPEEITQLKGVADDWKKPTEINMAQYDKVRAALEKDPETPQFIAEQKVNPFSVVEDGKYETESTANKFEQTAGKLSADMLRPSLQQADYTVPKTPTSEILPEAIKNIDRTYGVTADDEATILNLIDKKLEALDKKYPDGMSLTNMGDEKITYAQNGGYKPYAPAAENNAAMANRAISFALKDTLVSKAPKDLPVADFYKYEARFYKAADYLRALDGKKAPVSFKQQVARNVAKFGGAKLASYFGGETGGLISAFAGYQIGKALETMLENFTNPMRDAFLRNLKVTNPKAFTEVAKYLDDAQAQRMSRLLLPSGSSNEQTVINPKTGKPEVIRTKNDVPKIINAKSMPDESSVRVVRAKKAQTTRNPKTGRMQTTYTSEAE